MVRLKLKECTTTTYKVESDVLKGFYVDIRTGKGDDDDGFMYEAWLYHCKYGVKSLMFSCSKNQLDYYEFLKMVMNNVDNSGFDYIQTYC